MYKTIIDYILLVTQSNFKFSTSHSLKNKRVNKKIIFSWFDYEYFYLLFALFFKKEKVGIF